MSDKHYERKAFFLVRNHNHNYFIPGLTENRQDMDNMFIYLSSVTTFGDTDGESGAYPSNSGK